MIVCRICFTTDKLISLTTDQIDAVPILHMLNEFTIINAEQHLPKYICENCTNNLDIAYAFKRQYEDSIVKYMRRTSNQGETSKTAESTTIKMCSYSQCEDLPDGEQSMTEDTCTYDMDTVGYTLVTDSVVVNEIDIDEIDIKSTFNIHSDAEKLDDGGNSNNPTHDEMNDRSNDNSKRQQGEQDETSSIQIAQIRSAVIDGLDGTGTVFSEKESATVSGEEDGVENIPSGDPMRYSKDSQNKDQYPMASFMKSFGEMTEVCRSLNNFRVLRSNSHQDNQNTPLSNDILNEIYTFRYDRPGKPYKCDVCSRYFLTKGHIKTHRMRHNEREKTIFCTKCQLTFLTKPHFQNHKCNVLMH